MHTGIPTPAPPRGGVASAATQAVAARVRIANPTTPAACSCPPCSKRGALTRNPKEALASFAVALALQPRHATAHANRGILAGRGAAREALASYDAALALQPHLSTAHTDRGLALKLGG